MILSYNWLKKYIDISISPEQFAHDMTMAGNKVEEFHNIGDDIQNVVTGKILSVDKHPNADKLSICMLDTGGSEPLQIVTGATNINAGDMVPVALDGAFLPGGKRIFKGKLRGELSNGMLCSISELALTLNDYPGADEEGILILKEECEVGQDIKDVLLLSDTVFEFEITSNRQDCFSVIGLLREVCAIYKKDFPCLKHEYSENNEDINNFLRVEINNTDNCLRYSAKMIKNVKIEPSPLWLRAMLKASGIRPINNIVDITNYCLLEYGQPMHAFDYNLLKDKKIIVRDAKKDEKVTAINNEEYTLDNSMLVIADGEKPVAIAGVMGAQNSEIKDDTKTIIFEAASFYGPNVRKTSKKLGLRSDSSALFEKGLDPYNAIDAMNRACSLVEMLNAGEIAGGIIDIFSNPPEKKSFELEHEWINEFIGIDLSRDEMVNILTSLDIEINGDIITVPHFRQDLSHKADISEEIARIYGYDKIPVKKMSGVICEGKLTKKQKIKKDICRCMLSCGMTEIQTYSFVSPKNYDRILLSEDSSLRNAVTIENPLGEDTSVMRSTMLSSILSVLSTNINNRNPQASVFEIGTIYIKNSDDELPEEKLVIAMGMYGTDVDFYKLKGVVESIFDMLKIEADYSVCSDNPSYHPGRTANISIKENCGIIGQVSPIAAKNYGIDSDVYCAFIDFNELCNNAKDEIIYKQLPKFPAASRDIAVIADKNVTVNSLKNTIISSAGKLLESITLFDVYTGDRIDKDKKSIAYSLTFRANDRTLSDNEIDDIMARILKKLEESGATLR